MNLYQEILTAATLIKDQDMKGNDREGLCNLIWGLIGGNIQYHDTIKVMGDCGEDWNEFSGNRVFPIPSHVKHMSPIDIFFSIEHPNYEGEYGEARMRYLDHVIEWMSVRAANYDMSICGMEAEANDK